MITLISILIFAFGVAGCVAAQPLGYGYGDPPGFFAPRTSFGIGIGG
jgi:hypothetical protein